MLKWRFGRKLGCIFIDARYGMTIAVPAYWFALIALP
jgi:hypothetical protein